MSDAAPLAPLLPRRAVVVQISIGADDDATAIAELRRILDGWELHHAGDAPADSVSGSPVAGHWVSVSRDPSWTHERYAAALATLRAAHFGAGGPP